MGLLDGKVLLITGGGNGIGREQAILSARQGAKVVVNDLGTDIHGEGSADKSPAQQVVDIIRSEGGEAIANFDSVTDLNAVNRMVQLALDTFGGLHIISNPAGFLRDRMMHNMTEAEWDGIHEVHMKGHFNVVRASINHFRSQSEGCYVMWTSGSGLNANVGQANYASAKMGIATLSRVIAREGARYNIRSNAIAPSAGTRLTWSVPVKEGQVNHRAELEAKGEYSPAAPAQLALALTTPQAKDITGQIFGAQGFMLQLYSQPKLLSVHRMEGGWDAEAILSDYLPRVTNLFTPLDREKPPETVIVERSKEHA